MTSLLEGGKVSPDDTIVWLDGDYTDQVIDLAGVDGTAAQPITLRSQTPGGVKLLGKSQLNIGVDWWVLSGFHFQGKQGQTNSYNAIQFRSNGGMPAHHARLTDCAITDLSTEQSSSKWVLLFGRFNRIDHCSFSGKNSKGALVTIELGELRNDESAEHRIEWNYFANVSPQLGTDNETIRIGFSGDQGKPAKCVIRNNYFFRCDGENEIISSKSSYNVFQANTFRQCRGALVLRHGHHGHVEGNYFLGDGIADTGGIRIADSHHTIMNNYLQDLAGEQWNAAISVMGGQQKSGGTSDGYQAVDHLMILHNSVFNSKQSLLFNREKGDRAPTGCIANNLIVSSHGPLVTEELNAKKLTWLGNLVHGAEVGCSADVLVGDPQLRLAGGLLRPSPTGPAADRAVTLEFEVERDVEGQPRSPGSADIGADELLNDVSGNEVTPVGGPPRSGPLTPAGVGVSFLESPAM